MRGCVLFILLTLSTSALAAESDPYWGWRKPPDDATKALDRALNHKLVHGIEKVNARRPATCREAARILIEPLKVTSDHFFRSEMRRWPMDRSPRGDRTEFDAVSVYRNAPLFPFGHWVPLDPTLRVGDVLFGPDKIGHFFTNGLRSWEAGLAARDGGADDDAVFRAAMLYGVDEEKGWLGLGIDGVFSYADLHSASAGVRFYQRLCDDKDPLLVRAGDGRWALVENFHIADWVDPCWDESFNPSAFNDSEDAPVRAAMRESVCALVDNEAVQARREKYRARGCDARTQKLFAALIKDGLAPSPLPWDVEVVCRDLRKPPPPPDGTGDTGTTLRAGGAPR